MTGYYIGPDGYGYPDLPGVPAAPGPEDYRACQWAELKALPGIQAWPDELRDTMDRYRDRCEWMAEHYAYLTDDEDEGFTPVAPVLLLCWWCATYGITHHQFRTPGIQKVATGHLSHLSPEWAQWCKRSPTRDRTHPERIITPAKPLQDDGEAETPARAPARGRAEAMADHPALF